jgi:CRP-like cAMP-binding protein
MVTKEDLKSILVLRYLSDEMLDKLIPMVEILHFEEREVIFREGDKGIRFYLLKRGKIVLEKRISDKLCFLAGSVKPGYSFGWSAMLEEGDYTLDAIATEPCEVYSIKGDKIKKLLNGDHTMGYIMNQGLLRILKRRLDLDDDQ